MSCRNYFKLAIFLNLKVETTKSNNKLFSVFINYLCIVFLQVVTALGKTYHQKCFTCNRCRLPFPSGEKVTYTGKEVLCPKCVQIPVRNATPKSSPTTNSANGEFHFLLWF